MKNFGTTGTDVNEQGFTLIELLVVILIIGILAAIAIPAFLNQRKAAVDASVQSDVKNASTQVETWMVSHPSAHVPDVTLDGTDDPAGLGAISDIKVSSGTVLDITPGAQVGTYTINGMNSGGNDAVSGVLFNSATGGFTVVSTESTPSEPASTEGGLEAAPAEGGLDSGSTTTEGGDESTTTDPTVTEGGLDGGSTTTEGGSESTSTDGGTVDLSGNGTTTDSGSQIGTVDDGTQEDDSTVTPVVVEEEEPFVWW